MGKEIIKKEVYNDEGSLIDLVLLEGAPPNGGNGVTTEKDQWIAFNPLWRVGASGGQYANPGLGYIQGWYKEKLVDMFLNDELFSSNVKETEIFLELKGISPSIPAGEGFEFEVPEYLRPPSTDSARGGGGELWILGGENKFAIAPKWTDRNQRPMRIIIVGSGWEWTTNVPKEIPISGEKTVDLHFWMKYLR